ncbi:hypothetical protein ACIA8K_27610 [Catenuloplanes sp. NPDC051500]|uniref:hypothetical protein n=1 Tax=Catenuloplanes sp. NPDC051500 TaxID=3363959 RepID=UPI003791BA8A
MTVRRWAATTAAGLALLLSATACGGGGDDNDVPTPPAGGWPQATDGKISADLCALLTAADWEQYGHTLYSEEPDPGEAYTGANGVSCTWTLGDKLSVELQPNAESGTAAYQQDLHEHSRQMTSEHRESALEENVLDGADASWFDHGWIDDDVYELHAVRQGLLISIEYNKNDQADEGKAKEPKELLTGLVKTVYERIPNLGKNQAGESHKVKLAVEGNLPKINVTYLDPITGELVEKKDVGEKVDGQNVQTTFTLEFVVPERNQQRMSITGSTAGTNPLTVPALSCAIGLDGKQLEDSTPGLLAMCNAELTF